MTEWTDLPESGLIPADIGSHPGASTGNLTGRYQIDKALNGSLAADLANRVRWVSEDGSNTNNGKKSWSAKRHIEAALESLPDDGDGGAVFVVPGDYEPFVYDRGNTLIQGLGGQGADRQTGLGAVRVIVPDGQFGADICVDTAQEYFRGNELRNLAFVGVDGGDGDGGGVRIGRNSNFRFHNLTASDFAEGQGYQIKGSDSSQYGEMHGCSAFECKVGAYVFDHNGLRIFGGTFEYLTDDVEVLADTKGIHAEAASDSLKMFGTVIQFAATGCDLAGQNSYLEGVRFEACEAGVRLRGQTQTLGPGCSFNNFIIGGGGDAVVVHNTAEDATIYPFVHGALDPEPVTDVGVRTRRLDGYAMQVANQALAATGKIRLGIVPQIIGATFARYLELMVGTAIPAAGDQYVFQLLRSNTGGDQNIGPAFSTDSGWDAYERIAVDLSAANNNPVQPGDMLWLDVTKYGSPPAIEGLGASLVLVAY